MMLMCMPQHPNNKSRVEFEMSPHPCAVGVLEHVRWGKCECDNGQMPLGTPPLPLAEGLCPVFLLRRSWDCPQEGLPGQALLFKNQETWAL